MNERTSMNYNIEYIEKLRIHELRDYARKLGVSRPTTRKKEELLASIYEIVSQNGLEQESSFTNEGLDFFALLTDENSSILFDLLAVEIDNKKKRNSVLIKKSADNSKIEPFTFQIGQNSAEYTTDGVSFVKGFVDIHPNGYGIYGRKGKARRSLLRFGQRQRYPLHCRFAAGRKNCHRCGY